MKKLLHLLDEDILLELVSLPVQKHPCDEKDHHKCDEEVRYGPNQGCNAIAREMKAY